MRLRQLRQATGITQAQLAGRDFSKGFISLVETGRAVPHHVLPDSGWVSKPIGTEDDAEEAVELFRLSYERARVAQRAHE